MDTLFDSIKNDFPFFASNKGVIYLDSASTTQKTQCVIDAIVDFYANKNVNGGRGYSDYNVWVRGMVEKTRTQVNDWIYGNEGKVFFTSGFSDSQTKIAAWFGSYCGDGDEILYSPVDHESFVKPWFAMCSELKKRGIVVKMIPYNTVETGEAHIEDIIKKITDKTKIINISHIHNIYGCDSDIHRLDGLREKGILINVDATQTVGHTRLDVQSMGADIVSFSGHKMFAPFGTGVCWINKKIFEIPNLNTVDSLFEVGSYDYCGIYALSSAIDYIEHIGVKNINKYLAELTQYALLGLRKIDGIEFSPGPNYWSCNGGFGIISLKLRGVRSADVSQYLAGKNILVRTGHCTYEKDMVNDYIRISLQIYNTKNDLDRFLEELVEISRGLTNAT